MSYSFLAEFTWILILTLLVSPAWPEEEYKLLPYDAWDGYYGPNSEIKAEVYRPYPVIFVHGFAGGDHHTWDDVIESRLKTYYFSQFRSYELDQADQDFNGFRYLINDRVRAPYLERMHMLDPNGSIDTYNEGDEIVQTNPQGTVDGWADKLKGAIDALIADSGMDKVVLVCHSMGGLAARELLTNANSHYGDYTSKVARIITIDTPHAGSPLAKSASNMGNIYRHGWKYPWIGWVLTIVVKPFRDFLKLFRKVQLDGEAVRDMNPTELEGAPHTAGSHFLKNLGERRFLNAPDLFAISAVSSRSFAMILAGGGAMANEPHDGVVPLESQRGFPFVRDPYDGNYLRNENGRILTQERMFPTTERMPKENFFFPIHPLDTLSPLDQEIIIRASHGEAAFNAAGLYWENGQVRANSFNDVIVRYLDYSVPVMSLLDARPYVYFTMDPLYGRFAVSFNYTLGIANEYLPSRIIRWSKVTEQWKFPGSPDWHLSNNKTCPFENAEPYPAGSEFSITDLGYIHSYPSSAGHAYRVAMKFRNWAHLQSNALEFLVASLYPESGHAVWRRKLPDQAEYYFGTGTGLGYGGQVADFRDQEDNLDGIPDFEQDAYHQFSLPPEYSDWTVRRAILICGGSPTLSYLIGPLNSGWTWQTRPAGTPIVVIEEPGKPLYADITHVVSTGQTFTIIMKAPNLLPGSSGSHCRVSGLYVEYEPMAYDDSEAS